MIQVFTGDGKGKTTAALGQALRASGHGWNVLVIQFMKGDPTYGEITAVRGLSGPEMEPQTNPDETRNETQRHKDTRGTRSGEPLMHTDEHRPGEEPRVSTDETQRHRDTRGTRSGEPLMHTDEHRSGEGPRVDTDERRVAQPQHGRGKNREDNSRRPENAKPHIVIEQYGLPTFVEKGNPSAEDLRLARAGFERAQEAVKSGKWQMIVLDEINVAVDYGLLKLNEVLDLVKSCPIGVELVLTGRYAKKELIELADLVSEIQEVKHPYMKGIVSREGIDY